LPHAQPTGFIFAVAPLDYGLVLLLMPFGFRLTADSLPSGNYRALSDLRAWRQRAINIRPQTIHLLFIGVAAVRLTSLPRYAELSPIVEGVARGAEVTIFGSYRNGYQRCRCGLSKPLLCNDFASGVYTLSGEAAGFRKYNQTKIPPAVQREATFDVELRLGNRGLAILVGNLDPDEIAPDSKTNKIKMLSRVSPSPERHHEYFSGM
jgi:hypothetical protein